MIFDTGSGSFEVIENPSAQQSGGAGIQAGQLIVSKGVEAVLTGNMGPNAFQVIQAAGIKVITGVSGKISEAIEKYRAGKFEPVKNPNVGSKSGMSRP